MSQEQGGESHRNVVPGPKPPSSASRSTTSAAVRYFDPSRVRARQQQHGLDHSSLSLTFSFLFFFFFSFLASLFLNSNSCTCGLKNDIVEEWQTSEVEKFDSYPKPLSRFFFVVVYYFCMDGYDCMPLDFDLAMDFLRDTNMVMKMEERAWRCKLHVPVNLVFETHLLALRIHSS